MTGQILSLDERRERDQALAWERYLELRDRADKTRDFADAQAVGKAWAAFLNLFTRLP